MLINILTDSFFDASQVIFDSIFLISVFRNSIYMTYSCSRPCYLLKTDWWQLTKEILTTFYNIAGREELPWVHQLSAETQLEDIVETQKQEIRGCPIKLINDPC
jgi:hypothetical protein